MFCVIILDCICIALETYEFFQHEFALTFHYLNIIFTCIYILEIAFKSTFLRSKYFKNGWNIFDILIVIVTVATNLPMLYGLRSLRFLRILRSIRLISHSHPLQIILHALIKSISKLAWTGVLLLFIYYIYSILGVNFFGEQFHDWFGTLGRSAYTLFQIMTLESWSMGIARPVIAIYPLAWIYFVSYVILSSFIIMNVVVGIVVQTISECTEQSKLAQNTASETNSSTDISFKEELQRFEQQLQKIESMISRNQTKGKKIFTAKSELGENRTALDNPYLRNRHPKVR